MIYEYRNDLCPSDNWRREARMDAKADMKRHHDQEFIESEDGRVEYGRLVAIYYECNQGAFERVVEDEAKEEEEKKAAATMRAMAEANATAMSDMMDRRELKAERIAIAAEKAEAARLLRGFHAEQEKRSRWDYVDPNARSRKHL